MMPVELGLGDYHGLIEILVVQGGIQDLVAVLGQVGRLDAARCRLPAMKEENYHQSSKPSLRASAKSFSALELSPILE